MHRFEPVEAFMTTTNGTNGSTETPRNAPGLGSLPKRVKARFEANPVSSVAAVAAGSFVLGTLLGSRLVRLALAAAIPLAVERLFQGAVGEKLVAYARTVTGGAERSAAP
jgi:hypothetical protein